MGTAAKPTREHRTITVDFQHETPPFQLLGDGKAFLESQMPVTSTLLEQAHNAIERKLFAMKAFHPPGGSQPMLLTELAHLYTLVPYKRRPSTPGNAGWKWKAGEYPPRTGSSA